MNKRYLLGLGAALLLVFPAAARTEAPLINDTPAQCTVLHAARTLLLYAGGPDAAAAHAVLAGALLADNCDAMMLHAAPQAVEVPVLSETISVQDPYAGVTMTVDYPSGWGASGQEGYIMVADSQETLDALFSSEAPLAMEPGQFIMNIFQFPPYRLDEGTGPDDLLLSMIVNDVDPDVVWSKIVPFNAGDNSGVKAVYTGPEGNGFVYVIQFEDALYMIVAVSGDLTEEAAIDAAAASLQVTPVASAPVLSETISVQDPYAGVTITLDYPSGWAALTESGFIILADSQETLDALLSVEPPVVMGPGQFIISAFQLPGFLVDEGDSSADVVLLVTEGVVEQGGSVGEILPFDAGDNNGVKAAITDPGGSGFAYVIQIEGDFYIIAAVSDDPAGLEATSDAVAASLRVTPVAGD